MCLNGKNPLGVYPNSGSQDRDQMKQHWHQFPLLRWDDDDKRETVSNTKVSKRQTFSNKILWRSCELSFRSCELLRKMVMGYSLLVYFVPLPLPYDDQKMEPKRWSQKRLLSHKISVYLRAPLHPGKVRVFCALVPSIVDEAWILIGDVWNLVAEVQNLVALQTVW